MNKTQFKKLYKKQLQNEGLNARLNIVRCLFDEGLIDVEFARRGREKIAVLAWTLRDGAAKMISWQASKAISEKIALPVRGRDGHTWFKGKYIGRNEKI